jgi:hypothetical protein
MPKSASPVYGFRYVLSLPEVNVVQTWRQQAGSLLITFMVLDVLSVVCARTAGASLKTDQPTIEAQLIWLALDSLLVWRIWRHGRRLARIVLLIVRAATVLLIAVTAAWPWPWYPWGAIAITAAQATLLVSPAIRHHVRAESYDS